MPKVTSYFESTTEKAFIVMLVLLHVPSRTTVVQAKFRRTTRNFFTEIYKRTRTDRHWHLKLFNQKNEEIANQGSKLQISNIQQRQLEENVTAQAAYHQLAATRSHPAQPTYPACRFQRLPQYTLHCTSLAIHPMVERPHRMSTMTPLFPLMTPTWCTSPSSLRRPFFSSAP